MAEAGGQKLMPQFDVVVIGGGLAGMYQLYKLRGLGLAVQGFEAGGDVGGTWYWNRYPGCRLDSESYTYSYSFIDELLEEWNWSEHFATQPEILQYLKLAADKMDIRKNYRFNSRCAKAEYIEDDQIWQVTLEEGDVISCRFLISAVGPLSAPTYPKIDGISDFQGESYHTYFWPHEDDGPAGRKIDFAGKRVAVIGTGATGIQVIQEVAKQAQELETRKNRVISGWRDDVEAARRTKGIVRTDFQDTWR
ncbi:NAD(P)/FAD-dependent oxidoreductase [Sphingobium phenoxybenzoativorans]|uniref:NAD(P)/FAD-dependent oxidoreductase n=1 Tax=Sphingobium phenoxybenzoativorans TaxID=1592790 RepID=A0A975K9A5_9SPHN|nr:NAD(P)/FAD-dependent oxidoreductase [Sphingobium phenoxybenzoativorans]QUT06842.1 NAD(P)/FAD-dependent oxidoreductase [Sphingobium phenoxybenzoativorans]